MQGRFDSQNASMTDMNHGSINVDGEALPINKHQPHQLPGKKHKRLGRTSGLRNEASLVNYESGAR